MSHSFIGRLDGVPVAANDNRAPESWDEALATDLAILGPIAELFGWLCAWSAPGSYQVGPYEVLWREGTRKPYWGLSYQASDDGRVGPVDVASAWSLDAIIAVIVKDAAGRTAQVEGRDAMRARRKRSVRRMCNKNLHNIGHGAP